MAHPGVRRLRAEDVPPVLWEEVGLPFGLLIRELNSDVATGGRTLVVDVPDGWSLTEPHWNESDEEFLILEGEVWVDEERYVAGDYLFRRAGSETSSWGSGPGAQLLYWHDSEYRLHLDVDAALPADLLVVRNIYDESTWLPVTEAFGGVTDVGSHADLAVATKCIRLRTAEDTGNDTIIFVLPAGFRKQSLEFHHGTEELYFLSGWCATDPTHVYRPGEYLCWASGTIHGVVSGWDAICISKHHGGLTSPNVPVGATSVDIG